MEEVNGGNKNSADEFNWLIGGIALIIMGVIFILFFFLLFTFDLFALIAGVLFIISGILSLYRRKVVFIE